MKKIEVKTFATWVSSTGILGTHKSPLMLSVDIQNHTGSNFTIKGICISIKTRIIFFDISKDVMHSNKNYRVGPRSKFNFQFDIRNIQLNYNEDKRFTVKVFGDNEYFESKKLTVSQLNNIKSSF